MANAKGFKGFLGSKLFLLIILLLVIVAIFTVWAGSMGTNFLQIDTLISIGDLMIVTAFLAIGAGLLLVAGQLDLSQAAIGAFGCVIVASAIRYWAMPTGIAIVVALVCCTIFGIVNAVLVNEFNFQPFIATMATLSVVKGLMYLVSVDPTTHNPGNVNVSNEVTKFIGSYEIGGVVPFGLAIAILAFIVYGLILSKTKFGMSTYLVGGNPQAARLSGISPRKVSYILFANSGFLAGISGVFYMGRSSQGDLNALTLNQFTGLTAAILGGISFGGGSGNMAGVFVGLLILNAFSKGTTVVRFSNYWTTILSGLLLILALSLDLYMASRAKRSVNK